MSALWDEIDLSSHGIIEAHAGTGKTYTIVKLVLKILEQHVTDEHGRLGMIHLRELLLVTYTEKAAGELKKRIREGIKDRIQQLSDGSLLKLHLENCLNNLHEAFIGTIHAVCLRLLQSWPFESGVHFTTSIVDDREGMESALRESMRIDWQNEERALPWAFRTMIESGSEFKEEYFDLIVEIAVELLDDEFTALDRSTTGNRTLDDLRQEESDHDTILNENRDGFNDLLKKVPPILDAAFATGEIPSEKQMLYRERITQITTMIDTGIYDIKVLKKPNNFGSTKLLSTAKNKKGVYAEQFLAVTTEITNCPYFIALGQKETLQQLIPLAFIGDAAELAARRWRETKRKDGLLSYKDMLRLMHRAVCEKPAFVTYLRRKLRYTIIDEFQDTSRLQWEVFRKLCIDSALCDTTPRLFIVGDPKQSIYAFQGADVTSYLDARALLTANGGRQYPLTRNFRSLEATVAGYNAIFASGPDEENWFLFDRDSAGIRYDTKSVVSTPKRHRPPNHTLCFPPVQVIPLASSTVPPMTRMAEVTSRVIKKLIGLPLSIPAGIDWKEYTLNYGDVAVIVERHDDALPFLDEFRKHNIPAVKYKMDGVFQSPMALALHTLLVALLRSSGDPSPRLAVLLTQFFNRRPDAIDPDRDLEPCSNPQCSGDVLCIAHGLDEWTELADRSLWAQLFESIQRRTSIRERLLHLRDGERHLADLRQIIDYCLERLYLDNASLILLAEELHHLFTGEKKAAEDRNLHVLETEKSSVKVLTMHAAKGLEFPVVFVASGFSKTMRKVPAYIRYTAGTSVPGDGTASVFIAPYLSIDEVRSVGLAQRYLEQATQERRRLLYVALTRAQSILFLPLHCKSLQYADDGTIDWSVCTFNEKGGDNDLSRRLFDLLRTGLHNTYIAPFNPDVYADHHHNDTSGVSTDSTIPTTDGLPDIGALKLLSRICRQTSYSYLSRQTHTARNVDKSDEVDSDSGILPVAAPSLLPGSHLTGDALHCAIEELLLADNINEILSDNQRTRHIICTYLKRNGIITLVRRKSGNSDNAVNSAIDAACNCMKGALTTGFILPVNGRSVAIASLARSDRIPEMEFMLKVGIHWVHGFMDVVFRIPNPDDARHPWRYYVLDWKSDTLPVYNQDTIQQCIHSRHYYLQSRIYAHALDRYLHGVLGSCYRPEHHLGGAVYLFLREQEVSPRETATTWTYAAQPEEDHSFVIATIRESYQ